MNSFYGFNCLFRTEKFPAKYNISIEVSFFLQACRRNNFCYRAYANIYFISGYGGNLGVFQLYVC